MSSAPRSTQYAKENPSSVLGLDISCTDGEEIPPIVTQLSSAEVEEWFTSHPDGPAPALRLLVLPDRDLESTAFTESVVRHAIWAPDAYLNLRLSTGGCAALLDEPYCFVLQTPKGDGPACSLALSRHGHVVKGIYSYHSNDHRTPEGDATFEPQAMLRGERIQSGWRSNGMQTISLPQAVAKAQAQYISLRLSDVVSNVTSVEHRIDQYDSGNTDLTAWNQTLHSSSLRLLDLERRARLQTQILAAIESITTTHHYYKGKPYPPLAPLRSQLASWSFDFETLPRRIEAARSAISGILQQRNEQLNLSIAQSSRAMTEAALRDNVTMKTIAILTMVFLPSTAVATFFSMSMFNWSAKGGEHLETKWLWVFFAVAVPLTGLVLVGWYLWVRRYERHVERGFGEQERERLLTLDDGRSSEEQKDSSEDIEMQDVNAIGKGDGCRASRGDEIAR